MFQSKQPDRAAHNPFPDVLPPDQEYDPAAQWKPVEGESSLTQLVTMAVAICALLGVVYFGYL